MTTIELWNLIFSGFTAIGTITAVCISLWFAVGKKKRFSINDARMQLNRTEKDGELIDAGNFLYLSLENHLEFEMKVFEVVIGYQSKNKTGCLGGRVHLDCEGSPIFIPAISQYDIKVQIPRRTEVGMYKSAKRITLSVSTSFGNKTIPFPNKWLPQLIDSIEKK